MVSRLTPACCVLLIAVALAGARSTDIDQVPQPRLGSSETLVSSSSSSGLSKAPTDTFYLLGGPGTLEGKFENATATTADRQGWIGVDLTDQPVYWQVSSFNAENLGGNGVGNLAAWSGQSAGQQPGWASAPGYGNGWNDILQFNSGPVVDPTLGQTVSLDFVFNYDLEPGYDFLHVEYDSAGTWVSLLSVDGSNRDAGGAFAAPGTTFSSVAVKPIVFAGNDYGGSNGDEVVIRIRVTSDGAWSDEDGIWASVAGAAQVDDISVSWSDGSDVEDFESGAMAGLWQVVKSPFAGDFSRVWPKLSMVDLDPCAENTTPVFEFIDAGQTVGNAASAAAIPGYPTSTGGKLPTTFWYGLDLGYVVNYDGGLSEFYGPEQVALDNEIWSPPFDWDLPGGADDDPTTVGAKLRFSAWTWLPLSNGIFYVWHVRSTMDGTNWTGWQDRNFVYFNGGESEWAVVEHDVTDLLLGNPLEVQIALGVQDLALPFGFSGNDATPAPAFDNVSFVKYRVGGPVISASEMDLANDGFPVSGSIDATTAANRDALDVPFDMARDIDNQNPSIDPGDSIVVDVVSRIPSASLTDVRMVWLLDKNTLFEDALRAAPARAVDENVVTGSDQWSGEVVGSQATTSTGGIVADRYFFDLPDVDFLYPGDRIRYYFQATDSDGRTTTLPEDISGFATGIAFDRRFTVRALPSMKPRLATPPSPNYDIPPRLVILNPGSEADAVRVRASLDESRMEEGRDYDIYEVRDSASQISNGIGSSGGHGANAAQLEPYSTILHFAGSQERASLSDGSYDWDSSNDLGVLTAWHALPGDRRMAHFGDHFASELSKSGAAGQDFLVLLGIESATHPLTSQIDNQLAPHVRAEWSVVGPEFIADGSCPNLRRFDELRPIAGATRGHGFVDLANAVYPQFGASILLSDLPATGEKVDMTFAFSLASVETPSGWTFSESAATRLLLDTMWNLGAPFIIWWDPNPPSAIPLSMTISPNPFNPRTVIRFAGLPEKATGSVRVYSLRGELVATLHNGAEMPTSLTWSGQDGRGRAVASGVYLVEAKTDGFQQVTKVALLK